MSKIAGAELFSELIKGCLPYREKMLPELPGFSPYSDLHLVGDKLISVEVRSPFAMIKISVRLTSSISQGGVHDEVKIYQLVPEDPDSEA